MAFSRNALPEGIIFRDGQVIDLKYIYEVMTELQWDEDFDIIVNMCRRCPQSFKVAELNKRIIGFCMADLLGEEGHICNFYVEEEFRRRGIGTRLFTGCVEGLGDRNISLNSTTAAAPYYKKYFGFKNSADKIRSLTLCRLVLNKELLKDVGAPDTDASIKIVPLSEAVPKSLEEYDTSIHIVNRRKQLEHFRSLEYAKAALTNENNICGYGCLTKLNPTRYKLGPVFAETLDIAKDLMNTLLTPVPDGSELVVICVCENKEAVTFWQKLGMPEGIPVEGYFTRYPIEVAVDKVYCATSAMNAFA